MNRGSSSTANPLVHSTTSFNEAPIHESGKYLGIDTMFIDEAQLQ